MSSEEVLYIYMTKKWSIPLKMPYLACIRFSLYSNLHNIYKTVQSIQIFQRSRFSMCICVVFTLTFSYICKDAKSAKSEFDLQT